MRLLIWAYKCVEIMMSYTFDYSNMKFQVIPIKIDHAMDSCLGACHFLANSRQKYQFDLETSIFSPMSWNLKFNKFLLGQWNLPNDFWIADLWKKLWPLQFPSFPNFTNGYFFVSSKIWSTCKFCSIIWKLSVFRGKCLKERLTSTHLPILGIIDVFS